MIFNVAVFGTMLRRTQRLKTRQTPHHQECGGNRHDKQLPPLKPMYVRPVASQDCASMRHRVGRRVFLPARVQAQQALPAHDKAAVGKYA
ncbi:hypothetical protein [Xanthomonas fragariae]|uniref:hypothetical protein n=1 Tax=Xanthomonas fragariae TaxID=48664 RepID=UPI001ABEE3F3|nr:hypothetical protein [Xanthomonas fragariae]UKR52666.1 hypothetical protein K4A87_00310 [Xanthomonas fragariae]